MAAQPVKNCRRDKDPAETIAHLCQDLCQKGGQDDTGKSDSWAAMTTDREQGEAGNSAGCWTG